MQAVYEAYGRRNGRLAKAWTASAFSYVAVLDRVPAFAPSELRRGKPQAFRSTIPFMRTFAVIVVIALAGGLGAAQEQSSERAFSPLGYYDLRAYEQAYPGVIGSPEVRAAQAQRFWVFKGVAYRAGNDPLEPVWASLGPETVL